MISGADDAGTGWTYRAGTRIVSLLADAQVDGLSTNGAFRVHIPAGGASNIELHKLTLVAKNTREWSAIVVSNDVAMTVSRTNKIRALGQYAAGVEVATDASLTVKGEGSLLAEGGKDGAGIGSRGYKLVPGAIVIESGRITAVGGEMAAGIGGGLNCNIAPGGIVVKGGVVRAHGGINAAGIGPGRATVQVPDLPESAVTIEGGTVLAWGGEDPRQAGGFGGSKSKSDLILSLGSTDDVTGATYHPLVVTGGSIVPQAETIGVVAPRPANADGTALYSVTITNLVPNTAIEIACDDLPDDFGLGDIYSDDKGRVSIWLAPTNHARIVSVNGKYYETEFPESSVVPRDVYRKDVFIDAASGSDTRPESVDVDGETRYKVTIPGYEQEDAVAITGLGEFGVTGSTKDGDGAAVVYLPDGDYSFTIGSQKWSVSVDGGPATANENVEILEVSISPAGARLTLSLSAARVLPGVLKIYYTSALPYPEPPDEVDLSQCEIIDNGDGTATVVIPLEGGAQSMFYKIGR